MYKEEIMLNIIKSELIKETYKQGREKEILIDFELLAEDYIKKATEEYEDTGCHLEIKEYIDKFNRC
jgi:hypothetical protein